MSLTLERLQSLMLREIAVVVNKDRKIKGQMYFNITDVKVSRDYSIATVYYTILSDEEEELKRAEEILNDINKDVRKEVAQKVKNIRRMPALKFKFDESLAYGNKIDQIIEDLKNEQ
ncbi:MAG TPA: 30S ribosome-binding factor RbfA [Acholeplasma sp.]|jgi:ribosome-binding factor A|nr:30S ribosome-binding factor RbfA [Acholeplasmatales bacterium]HHV33482.1 30S ribosome-binding factor RbfA [Acholeplasma sp.]